MRSPQGLPHQISGIAVPQDRVSAATWTWAQRHLPGYLLAHSVRAFCWGAEIGRLDGLTFEPTILWTAALIHDVGLTRIPRNDRCFEFQGGAIARRLLVGEGMPARDADRVRTAIELHMAPSVTISDGAESVLLDRATGLDVRGTEFELVDAVRPGVMRDYPRGAFDRLFLAAITREVVARPGCQSERLLRSEDLAEWMARSSWAATATRS